MNGERDMTTVKQELEQYREGLLIGGDEYRRMADVVIRLIEDQVKAGYPGIGPQERYEDLQLAGELAGMIVAQAKAAGALMRALEARSLQQVVDRIEKNLG
tara:strand:+ start:1649 stop:1951 length:303 start_codon:yes stop_codon:yes gene_type:complete